MRERVVVSPEMLTFVGDGAISGEGWPDEPIMLRFDAAGGGPMLVELIREPAAEQGADAPLVLVVTAQACRRLFPAADLGDGCWHLPSELRAIVVAICTTPPTLAATTLRLAKSIELFCGLLGAIEAGTMVPADGSGELSELDARRIAAARRLIDERWHEKLTLDVIARACGINRAKLTRGFRQIFGCTVADAIADQRLKGARNMLLATDLPVSSVGFACGYLNNASFTRAFSRRFGQAPTQLRQHRVAA